MSFYIYKALQKGLIPVARLDVYNGSVRVQSSEQEIQQTIKGFLPRDVLFSQWEGDTLIKRRPKSDEGRVEAALKRFLVRPYFASRDAPTRFVPRYMAEVDLPKEIA